MQLSEKVNKILKLSKMNGDKELSPFHMVNCMLMVDESLIHAISAANVSIDDFKLEIDKYITYDESKNNGNLSKDSKYVIKLMTELSELLGNDKVEYGVFLYVLINEIPKIKSIFMDNKISILPDDKLLDVLEKSKIKKDSVANTPLKFLKKYSINLTEQAREGLLQNAIAVDDNVNRLIDVLSRKKKNNPILIGEPGVGKSTIIDELAIRVSEGNCPINLIDKEIYTLNIAALVAGTKYRGEFEERLGKILKELNTHKNVIVFIDEIHTIVGTGNDEKTLDVSNIIKPALANGNLTLIGATTLVEYKQIEKDKALARRFAKITVNEPSIESTVDIINSTKHIYQNHHNIEVPEVSVQYLVEMCDKYLTTQRFPDKAFDIIDELGVLNKTEETLYINNDHINEVISKVGNIDISKITDDIEKINDIDDYLKSKIYGQDNIINDVTYNIKKHKLGFSNSNTPIMSSLFLGETGVGKTQLAKEIANYLYENNSQLIKLDMSEYPDKHDITKLIGSAPGYVGYENGGVLLNKVKNNPNSVIIFDEVEKAHKDIFNILLQILDDGELHDTDGDVVNFRNTIIILTSNYKNKSDKVLSFGGSSTKKEELDLKGLFNKELLNRLDTIVRFNDLDADTKYIIAADHLKAMYDKFMKNDISTIYTNNTIKHIAKISSDARLVIKNIEKEIENKIIAILIDNNINSDININIDIEDEKFKFEIN